MSTLLYVLVVWLLASVPFALFFGAVCRLSEWLLEADAPHIAPGYAAQTVGVDARTAAPSSALLSPMRT